MQLIYQWTWVIVSCAVYNRWNTKLTLFYNDLSLFGAMSRLRECTWLLYVWGLPWIRVKTPFWLALLKACHLASSTGCLLGITPVQWWIQGAEFPARCGHECVSEWRARPRLGCEWWEASTQCEGLGSRKSWWGFTKGRGCWNLQRPHNTFSSTSMCSRVTGQCPRPRSASGASSTCTMSWGTFTPMVSAEMISTAFI